MEITKVACTVFHFNGFRIVLFLFLGLCGIWSTAGQCNNANKKVGGLIPYGTDNGQKTPLILIHGIHGTELSQKRTEANQYWNAFKTKFVADKDLMARYVIYDFQYYSNMESVQDIACELGLFIDEKIPDRKHVILAHSMGGLVAKAYMVFYPHKTGKWIGTKGGDSVIGAITLATPHHGTHGSNDVRALAPRIKYGWKQVIDKINFLYWSLSAGFFSPQTLASGMPNRGDLRWDNYDNAIAPNNLTNNDVNIWLPVANERFEQFASKVVLYAGALRLKNTANSPQAALAIAARTPTYDDHQRLDFANDVLMNGFDNRFGPTDGLVPYKSALLCDHPEKYFISDMADIRCASKYKVRGFEPGDGDYTVNYIKPNILSVRRSRRGYDHKDMYEHPDVLTYVASDLKGFVEIKDGASEESYNAAYRKPVTVTTNNVEESDNTGNCNNPGEVTDGLLQERSQNCLAGGVFGYQNNDFNQPMIVNVTIDLQDTFSITKIRYNPGNVQRAETWNADLMTSPFGSIATIPGTPWKGAWTEQTGPTFNASKITIEFRKTRTYYPNDWLFIGEIEVIGYRDNRDVKAPDSDPPISLEDGALLKRWLIGKPGWRPATKSDALLGQTKETIAFLNSEMDALNQHPYYVASDFNGDGTLDFAIVLKKKVGKTNRFALAVFNGPFNSKSLPAFYTELIQEGDWIFWMTNDEFGNRFIIGPPSSDSGFILKPRGNKYLIERPYQG